MYTRHIISISNPKCIFKFAFKRALTSFNFFFFVFKTHIVNLIKSVLIKTRHNIFRCFLHSTYFFTIMQQDFIHCTINNIIILLMTVKFLSWCHIVPTFLIRYFPSIIRTKFSQDLASIWLIPRAMYEIGFGLTYWVFYISFSALVRALTNSGVSMWWNVFFSIFPSVTITFGIFPSKLFIRRVYYTFINMFSNIHALKQ